ncbi:MAG: Na/Pi cotransporter family protein [Breznakia sp.]
MIAAINADSIQAVGFVLGGLALFVYGINQMSDGLKSIAGHKIRDYIEKYTNNLFSAVLVGTIITALLHSSTAVTVISISLVRAGLMKLEQAIGITIGANIGTCVTSVMIGLNVEQVAYYFVCAGVLVMFLAKRKTITYVGKVMLGFGLLFVGLKTMGDQLELIAKTDWFASLFEVLGEQPWYALFGGTLATAVVQSSTAIIGIVQKLYVSGTIAPAAGAAFIFGANVGTCITALIVGVGGSISSKRAAYFHAVYNVLGALLGMLLMTPFLALTNTINEMLHGNAEMWIAQAHLIFNIISTILVIPFVHQIVRLLEILIPGEDQKSAKIETIDELDYSLIERFPAAALEVAKKNTLRMGKVVLENIKYTKSYLETKNIEDYEEVEEIENIVNKYDTTLSRYLLKIAQQQTLAKDQTVEYSKNFQIVKNLERMSDIAVNLADFYKMVYDEKGSFSDAAYQDIIQIYEILERMLPEALYIYKTGDVAEHLEKLNEDERYLNELEIQCRDRHFNRMMQEECEDQIAAAVIVDILSNLERMGDHSLGLANSSIVVTKSHEDKYLEVENII